MKSLEVVVEVGRHDIVDVDVQVQQLEGMQGVHKAQRYKQPSEEYEDKQSNRHEESEGVGSCVDSRIGRIVVDRKYRKEIDDVLEGAVVDDRYNRTWIGKDYAELRRYEGYVDFECYSDSSVGQNSILEGNARVDVVSQGRQHPSQG